MSTCGRERNEQTAGAFDEREIGVSRETRERIGDARRRRRRRRPRAPRPPARPAGETGTGSRRRSSGTRPPAAIRRAASSPSPVSHGFMAATRIPRRERRRAASAQRHQVLPTPVSVAGDEQAFIARRRPRRSTRASASTSRSISSSVIESGGMSTITLPSGRRITPRCAGPCRRARRSPARRRRRSRPARCRP